MEDRDPAADSVRLKGANDREFTIGARAASKVLVQVARVLLLICALAASASAQTNAGAKAAVEPFAILDNSFLVEEAFNQPAGIFQNISGALIANGNWGYAFTQEWPVRSQKHQVSYTLSFLDNGDGSGFGDTQINYRYQAMLEGPGRPAFSPRASVIVPTGDVPRLRGSGSPGLQFNLPFSKQTGDWYWHWNAGLTWLPTADAAAPTPLDPEQTVSVTSPFFAASGIFRLRPMLNLMLEGVLQFQELPDADSTIRETFFTLSPGIRGGWNIGNQQLIAGVAVPITWAADTSDAGVFLYLSYELPFKK